MKTGGVVVDTSVVVAGLLTQDVASPVARILDAMLDARFAFVVSEELLGEYRAVLVRPALRKLHGLKIDEIDALLTDLMQHAIVLVPGAAGPAFDPGDQFLWNLLAARCELRLVSGDRRLLQDAGMRGRVISPRAFGPELT